MDILHVVPSFGFGGMEKIICAIINHTSHCYDHKILSLDNSREARQWIKNGVAFIDFDKVQKRLQFFKTLYIVVRRITPDLLMTYNWGATDAIWLGRIVGVTKIIHSEHGVNIDEAKKTACKRDLVRLLVYRMTSRLIVVTHEFYALARKKYSLRKEKIIHIPNGVNTDYYAPDIIGRQQTRYGLGFADQDFVVGFSGRLDPIKNFPLLLETFAHCARDHTRLRLLLVGEGPERKRIETFCQQENIWNRVILTGQQENVLPYLRAMDVFLLTSFREQMPLTVLEAMAVGVPVVATSVGEIPYIIDDGITGFIHNIDDSADAFARSLSVLLSPERRIRMGETARKKIIGSFQEQDMIRRYQRVIETLR
jgi:glycosyltransferase involved in cell wall biosynthesis